jgi:hypothetical protein
MLGFAPGLISAKSFLSILSEIITDQTFFGPAENPASLENNESVAYFSANVVEKRGCRRDRSLLVIPSEPASRGTPDFLA